MSELKNEVEAILFAAGKKVTYEEFARICNADLNSVKAALQELKKDYDQKSSSLLLTEEADGWKLTVREKYLPTVHKLMPETELSKTILETLAVIAWKQPALQSDVIKIRTNKAYDHIKELEELGFVTKEKKGRSYLLKVSQKFHEYFDLPDSEAVRKLFKDVKEAEEAQKKLDQLEVYEEPKPEKKKEVFEEGEEESSGRLDHLEIYNLPKEEAEKEEQEETEEAPEEEKEPEKKEVEELEEASEEVEEAGEEEKKEEPEETKEEGEEAEEKEEEGERKLNPALESLLGEKEENNKKKK